MKNKKIKLLTLSALAVMSIGMLSGCSMKNENTGANTEVVQESTSEKPSAEKPSTSTTNKNSKVPVTLEQIELVDFELVKETIYDNNYLTLQTKFKNNSNKNIAGISLTYNVGGVKEYLSTYDTLLPGETSLLEYTSCDNSEATADDITLLKAEIEVINEDGSTTYIEYDAKLNTYTTY